MEVNVEQLGPCAAKVQFTVPAEEFDGAVRKALQNAGRNVRMKGFRAGHVPRQVVEKAYGKRVRHEAMEHFLRQAYQQAIGENDLKVVGFERVDLDQVEHSDGSDFSHAFELSLRPRIELEDYTGRRVESQLEPVLDQEIEAALEDLRRQQAHPEPAGEAGLPEDGMALCDLEWLANGETVFERKGLRLSPVMPVPGVEPDAWKDAMSGKKDGETVELGMVFPPDFDREALRGEAGTCKVRIDQAYAMVLPEDADLERLLGVEEGETLQQAVRTRIDEIKREAENRRIEQHLIDELLARQEIDLPEKMLAEQTRIRLNQAARELKEQGVPDAELEARAREREGELREVSAKGLRTLFLIQALAEKEGLLVNNDDMLGELRQIAERNQTDLAEVTEYYKKNELFDQMAIEILERKVRRFLRESAEVTQPS